MRKLFALLFFVLLYHTGFSQWVNLDSLPAGRAAAVSFAIGDTGYIVSGGGSGGYWQNAWKYDKVTNAWTAIASLPTVSQEDNSLVGFAIGDTGYVGTGVGPGYAYSSSFWKYDTRQNTWVPIANFPGGGRCSSVSFVINGKGYVGGGFGGYYIPDNDFYAYDPSRGQWTSIANCPARGVGVNAVSFALNGKGYVGTGGQFTSGSTYWVPQQDMWAYDPGTNQWDSVAPVPCVGRMGAVAFASSTKGYVGTGVSDPPQQDFLRDFWEFDPTVGTLGSWRRIEDYAGAGRYKASTFVIDDEGYVCAGFVNSASISGQALWKYIPTSGGAPGTLDIEPKSFSVCPGQSVQLTVTGNAGIGSGLAWSPSTGLNKTTGDTVTATIIQNIVYTVTSAGGCGTVAAIGTDTISVNTGTVKVKVSDDTLVCSGSRVQLQASGATMYAWSPGGTLNDSTIANPYATPITLQVYTVIGTSVCGSDTEKVRVNVTPAIQVSITPTGATGCSGTQVLLSASGATTYVWTPNAGLSSSTISSLSATLDTTITYTVTGSTGACTSTGTVVIEVGNSSTGGVVTAVRDTICQGTPGNLTLSGNSSNTIQWQSSLNNINFNNEAGDTLAKYKTTPLLQTTWYRAIVGTGSCSAISDTLQLYVPPPLTASFYYTQMGSSQLIFNSDSSVGNIRSYHWDFGDGQTSNDSNPSHTYSKDSTYYVCLTLYDGSNCSYTFCRYSSLTDGVPIISATGNWIVYPDPFTNQLAISARKNNTSLQSIEIYNVLGQIIINKNIIDSTSTVHLDVSLLSTGIYFVMIKTTDGDYVQKVIKQ